MTSRPSFEITSVPTLDLGAGTVSVDIGYLGGQEHRDAFVDIFAKMLRDSARLLADCRLERIESKRAVRFGPPLPIGAGDLIASPAPFARAIYDSGNEVMVLLFANGVNGGETTLRIGVRFDNPGFWRD